MIGDKKEDPHWVCLDCSRLYYFDDLEAYKEKGCFHLDCGGKDLVNISWMRDFLKMLDMGIYEIRSPTLTVRTDPDCIDYIDAPEEFRV